MEDKYKNKTKRKDVNVKRIDIKEFRAKGFLQEVNRKFFHPLGLALEVVVDQNGSERLGGIWDYRKDPEGIMFAKGMIKKKKTDHVFKLRMSKMRARRQNEKCNPLGIQTK